MIRSIIVEDEPHSQKTLTNFLKKYCAQVELITIAATVKSAVEEINKHKPDLIFLDIDLPDGTGFEMLTQLLQPWPRVIFVTAYNQYAVKAFQISAIDYILKPVDPELLIKAVEKVQHNAEPSESQSKKIAALTENTLSGKLNKMALPTQQGIQLVKIDEIVRFEADGNYTTIFLTNKSKHLVSKKIKEFEGMLENTHFFRIH
ncbi:MAG: LytTR family DNA-binding domain-containing protein, partial [Bacteroidales bacterium]|nr:LytTR family DNA-binding domain-containing protein [Bacteroidales bacterium]